MNHTFRTRSTLVRHAEKQLRREQSREASAKIFAVCFLGMVVLLLAALIDGVMK